ncbi:Coiled-coil domain-containing protein 106 [Takifugu flavidus]|uniref:Coiled-coil domain-containing protein 106 n=1 Tax=Takifugu flavidus TaxID=433684 RepID=A0A5C6NVR0_9TELE|nr:Coiled-coil domain-containing protein 106 [Takifugu flavidus]
MSSVWHPDPSGFSPCMEIDSSSVRCKERLASPSWLKQEQDDLRIIKWESCQTGTSADAVQDNTPSSAMSAASHVDGLPPRVLLTITKLQCMLESKQERIAALEKQVEDLMQDRKFLRTQVENLTSSRSMQAFAPPAEAPKPSKGQHSDGKSRKRERASCSSSDGSPSGSEASDSSEASAASSEHRRKKHHKEKKRSKKTKDYSRKRGTPSVGGRMGAWLTNRLIPAAPNDVSATGVQYVIHRYKQVLTAFVKKKNMSEAFRHLGIDRNTIANTASIAELHLAGVDFVHLVGRFRQGEETLVNYAQRCTMVIDSDSDLSQKIDQMKANGELLPISGKRPRGVHSQMHQIGGATESILIG